MDISISNIILIALVLFLLHFLYENYKIRVQFESKGIPYLGNGAVRLVIDMLRGLHIMEGMTESHKKIKDSGAKFGGSYDFGKKVLVITDPDLLKAVLVKDFDHFQNRGLLELSDSDYLFKKMLIALRGQEWRALRSKLSPTFTTGKIKRLFPLFDESGRRLMKYFQNQAETSPGQEIELSEGYSKFAMDIIASAVCGMNSQAFDQKEPSLFERMGQKMQVQFGAKEIFKVLVIVTAKWIANMFQLAVFDMEMQAFFSKAIKANIHHRMESKEKGNDFIQLMLEAREGSLKSEEAELDNFEKDATLKVEESSKDYSDVLNDDGIVANAVLFILAGFDTTQSLLLFLPYVLALNPEIQDRLRAEVDAIFDENDGKLSYDAVSKMTYLEMVMNETLRMYPPMPLTDRGCTKDYKIPGSEFVLEKDKGGIALAIYAIHHDPEYYPDPEKFDPERFSPENKAKINPYTFLPFGQGPRNCIGMRFALAEVKVAIAHLLHNFRIEPSKKTPIPVKFAMSNTLRPKDGMHLALHKIGVQC